MTRILLAIDDYNESIYLQTLLKKLGFDVDSVAKASKFADTLLGFNPKFIIMTAHGKSIKGIEISKTIVKRNSLPRLFLLKHQGQVFTSGELTEEKIDKVLESPVNILNLIKCLCEFDETLKYDLISSKLSNILTIDKEVQEKEEINISTYKHEDSEELLHIKGENVEKTPVAIAKSSLKEEDRALKYQNFLQNMESPPKGVGGFPKESIKEYNKKHRVKNRSQDMKELDENKKEFVRALYSHLKKPS
ncbi:MAG: hypothetical protein KDD58_03975 [Bdellovibrionales bacterium]|nr:hypothetical protein [Bdellovibrionales bacterium]